MSATVRDLLDHLCWADDRTLEVIESEPRAASDAEVLRTLAHIAGCEALWLARMRGERSPVAVWPALSLEECAALFATTHAELRPVRDALSSDALARPVAYVNSAGASWTSSVEEILVHLAMHGQYHRGQLVRAIRRVGGTPASTDFAAWARSVRRGLAYA